MVNELSPKATSGNTATIFAHTCVHLLSLSLSLSLSTLYTLCSIWSRYARSLRHDCNDLFFFFFLKFRESKTDSSKEGNPDYLQLSRLIATIAMTNDKREQNVSVKHLIFETVIVVTFIAFITAIDLFGRKSCGFREPDDVFIISDFNYSLSCGAVGVDAGIDKREQIW